MWLNMSQTKPPEDNDSIAWFKHRKDLKNTEYKMTFTVLEVALRWARLRMEVEMEDRPFLEPIPSTKGILRRRIRNQTD